MVSCLFAFLPSAEVFLINIPSDILLPPKCKSRKRSEKKIHYKICFKERNLRKNLNGKTSIKVCLKKINAANFQKVSQLQSYAGVPATIYFNFLLN